ncbi:MAG TPA: biotin--[acetyl-CoA-carboxylase] ligase [Pyrinomonadaceae bacterium]|jgi:BirA family biotin operon repressor/biotin-[acetyl-CoA-carboxylase] ligase
MRPTILRYDSLPSTNTEAARVARLGAPEGFCVIAREQTAGRGRRERVWVSTMDAGLYFSIVLRPGLEQKLWPLLTLMSALAVHSALQDACELETDIKWPNDVYAKERKLCGILAETVEGEAGRAVIIGIGINLNDRAFPEELKAHATSVEAETGRVVDRERLIEALVSALSKKYEALQQPGGVVLMLGEWSERSSYAMGKRVRVELSDEMIEGTTRGLEPDGALRVETVAGEIKIVYAGDVTALRQT